MESGKLYKLTMTGENVSDKAEQTLTTVTAQAANDTFEGYAYNSSTKVIIIDKDGEIVDGDITAAQPGFDQYYIKAAGDTGASKSTIDTVYVFKDVYGNTLTASDYNNNTDLTAAIVTALANGNTSVSDDSSITLDSTSNTIEVANALELTAPTVTVADGETVTVKEGGSLTINGAVAGTGTINVEKGGELTINNTDGTVEAHIVAKVGATATINGDGTVTITGSSLIVNNGASVVINSDVTVTGTVTVGEATPTENCDTAASLTVNGNMELASGAELTVVAKNRNSKTTKAGSLTINGDLIVTEYTTYSIGDRNECVTVKGVIIDSKATSLSGTSLPINSLYLTKNKTLWDSFVSGDMEKYGESCPIVLFTNTTGAQISSYKFKIVDANNNIVSGEYNNATGKEIEVSAAINDGAGYAMTFNVGGGTNAEPIKKPYASDGLPDGTYTVTITSETTTLFSHDFSVKSGKIVTSEN